MDSLLEKIAYLTVQDVERPLLRIEDLKRISPFLDESNWMTYYIFLQCAQDLREDEKQYYTDVINELIEAERELIKSYHRIENDNDNR
jgi:hypothetical protein